MRSIIEFAWANAAYLLSGKLRSKRGYTPQAQHVVPENFSCVGVASSNNPETDAYILERLSDLHIKAVRIDITYGDLDSHAGRFLNALIHAGYEVNLHLVQPFDEAQQMHTHEAQQAWQDFVESVCNTHGKEVRMIEVGSTINRKRWAGYTLDGFLQMWAIAHKTIKEHGITLAGPSVTDFEPLYNIGLLAMLKRRKQLPDIHTDNLFSERCTEPERDDHKILGHRLAPLGGFRLVKKAFVLQEIGAHFGVPNTVSPSAFWTLPRIARLLPDTEQKQADYLSRYMVLCAASGVLKSAGWGPLICHREGLVDDGVKTYPKLERITLYQNIGADVSTYRTRSAFYAFSAFNRLIPGLRYLGQLNHTDCLEIHAFAGDGYQLHVLWTTNGKVASLSDIYAGQAQSADVHKNVTYINRDGIVLQEPPHVVTESPLYIRFHQAQPVLTSSSASILPSTAVHAHMPDTQYFEYKNDTWHGLIAAKNQAEFEVLMRGLDPTKLVAPSKETALRKARNAIWTIPDPRDSSKKLVVKQPIKMHAHKRWLDQNKPSKGLRSWTGAQELLRRGVNNARPVAYFARANDTSLMHNYYICEYVAADFSVRDMFTAFASGENSYQGITQEIAYEQVCDFLLNMHNKGAFFRDLSGGNILVNKISEKELSFSLIDTGRAHFYNHGTVISKRLSDMARACNKLHAEGRDILMSRYMEKLGRKFSLYHKLPFYLYNIKVAIKRQLKVKNIKKKLGIQ